MDNDAPILGINFEPKDEGIRYINQHMNVISFWVAIHWLTCVMYRLHCPNRAMFHFVPNGYRAKVLTAHNRISCAWVCLHF